MVKLQYILKALDDYLNNANVLPELAALSITSSINPWSSPRNTPWMTYFWRAVDIVKDTNVTALLDIMVVNSIEHEDGPMDKLTTIAETIVDALFKADSSNIHAVDVDSKFIKILEIRPIRFQLIPDFTDQGWVHTLTVECMIKYVR